MTSSTDSQEFESYVPVYDAIPESWEEAKPFLVEQLKKISNAVNVREIGFFLDEELLSGKAFIPGATVSGNNPSLFRSILRKTFIFGPIAIGVNTQAHGIVVDANFTLIQIFASGTTSAFPVFTGDNIPDVGYDNTNIIITSTKTYTRAVVVIEYIQEL